MSGPGPGVVMMGLRGEGARGCCQQEVMLLWDWCRCGGVHTTCKSQRVLVGLSRQDLQRLTGTHTYIHTHIHSTCCL